MGKTTKKIRSLALVLACAVSFIMSFSIIQPTFADAASSKAVKSLTLKIGKTKVTKKTYKVKKGKTAYLKTYVSPKTAKKAVYYKTSNSKIATVSKSGKIVAKNVGTAKISVKVKGKNKKYKSTYMYVKVYKSVSAQSKAYSRLMKLKKQYPEGKKWDSSKYYYWKAKNINGFACYAYVAVISDKVFGKNAKIKTHKSYNKIKVGDHVRVGTKIYEEGYHSVIVASKNDKYLTVTEGNFYMNGKPRVHWGRKISKSTLYNEGFYVDTRY